jgi:uncharacterized protein YjbI with pentapeptide repeats
MLKNWKRPDPSTEFSGELVSETRATDVALRDRDLSGAEAHMVRLHSSLVERVLLIGATLRNLNVWNSAVERGDWSGARCEGAQFDAAHFEGVRMRGILLPSATITHCVFKECQFDGANLRFAQLESCRFEDCSFVGADFNGVNASNCVFERCQMKGVTFRASKVKAFDLRTSEIGEMADVSGLSGAIITPVQMIDIAPQMAHAMGLQVGE